RSFAPTARAYWPGRGAPAGSGWLRARADPCRKGAAPRGGAGWGGRRRGAYGAPPAPADRGIRLGGAESKRRRCPRLPAPQSRVTLRGRQPSGRSLGGAARPCYATAMELRGAAALVTGASRGVGRAVAVALAEAGA